MLSAATSEALTPLKRAFLALEDAEARLAAAERALREPIAVIGLGCRTPGGVRDPDGFWRLLQGGVDATGPVPADRWDHDAIYNPDPAAPGCIATRRGGFIDGVDRFDPAFFGIAPREAEGMDPQQRLFLEVCWHSLEHAGQAPERLHDSPTGVYVGVCSSDYAYLQVKSGDAGLLDAHFTSGIAHSVFSGRLSYLLGLRGPSLTIDTACSSSLVAVHLACQALRGQECRMALAGGVNLMLAPDIFIALSHARMLAPDGRCKTFDASADGFARGEGCGVVVLKRLSDARVDGDRILAVIRGSAVNQDGPSSSLTAPNGPAQEAVIRAALSLAGVAPREVGYVEAHGTGTQLGDPMEVAALAAVFGRDRHAGRKLMLGSVKTNIGHLEAAAGVTGLIKVVLALHRRRVPPHLHFATPSSHIAWSELPFAVPTELAPFEPIDGRRIAGVSSFGFSGTNAHVVLEEAPPQATAVAEVRAQSHLLAISARNPRALTMLAAQYADALTDQRGETVADICRTANAGRSHFAERATVVAESVASMHAGLQSLAQGQSAPNVRHAGVTRRDPPRFAFLFTGQGAQYAGMARGLYEAAPVFRRTFDLCAELLKPQLDLPLLDVIFADDPTDKLIDQTVYTQPALFAIEYALAELWRSWGVSPSVVMGHSVGEFAAACVAGLFSVEDALRLVAMRGRLMQELPAGGAMAAVLASEPVVAQAVEPFSAEIAIAAVNSPRQTVISGLASAVAAVSQSFLQQGVQVHALPVSHAFHSPMVDPVLDRFEEAVASVRFAAPRIRLISNLSGDFATAAELASPSYWRRHMRYAVRFGDGLRTLCSQRPDCCIEIGPHPTLLPLASAALAENGTAMIASLRRRRPDWPQMLDALASAYLAGAQIDWRELPDAKTDRIIDLPLYPFQRERYWFRAKPRPLTTPIPTDAHPLLGAPVRCATSATIYESRIGADTPAFAREHRIVDRIILPATAYLEMIAAGARTTLSSNAVCIEDIAIGEALLLPENGPQQVVQTVFEPAQNGLVAVSVSSVQDQSLAKVSWTRHVSARVRALDPAPCTTQGPDSLMASCPTSFAVDAFYDEIGRRGAQFGDAFRTVRRLWRGPSQALGQVSLAPREAAESALYGIHPVLLDGCLQVIAAALPSVTSPDDLYLPLGIGSCNIYRSPGDPCWSHVVVSTLSSGVCCADIRVWDADGRVVAELRRLQLKQVSRAAINRIGASGPQTGNHFYEVQWRRAERAPVGAARRRQWLVFADAANIAAQSAARNQADGDSCIIVRPGRFARDASGFSIDPGDVGDYQRLLAQLRAEGSRVDAVVHAWSLDDEAWGDTAAVGPLLLAKALVSEPSPPSLYIVTRGGQFVADHDRSTSPAQGAVWGLARTIAIEHPELDCRCIDLDPDTGFGNPEALAIELHTTDAENQVAVRGGDRFVARLARRNQTTTFESFGSDWRLVPAAAGSLAKFVHVPLHRQPPGPGEVEIAVEAAGLNFKDVLRVLGMTPGDNISLGGECAGRVTAVGVGVSHVQLGDAVMAVAWGSLASHVVTKAELVQPKPSCMSTEEAAAFPVAYITAEYCLSHVGKIGPGDRVLIHAGTGGVGMAAIRLAQLAGAEVFATAGAEWKRELLRTIGVSHVFDSRSTDFADAIMTATSGHGVDFVLNSLTGAMIEASFDLLVPGGQFIELGKRDLKSPEWVAARGRDLRYVIVDWSEDAAEHPSLIGAMLAKLADQMARGLLKPLPRHVFAIEDASCAFRLMAQAKHVGKIVLRRGRTPAQIVRRDGTYLITGGMSGLGLRTAEWLAEKGAGRLVLIGRRKPGSQAIAAMDRMRAAGTQVMAMAADVTDAAALGALLATLRSEGPPLRGVLHAAGVLRDAALMRQDAQMVTEVLEPKLHGARLLDQLTRADALDWFVMYSSIAGVLGAAGQAGYAAANAALDQLAYDRRQRGLCATSIAWGGWEEIGAAVTRGLSDRHAARGLNTLSPTVALAALERVLEDDSAQVCVVSMDWTRYVATDHEASRLFLTELLGGRTPASVVEAAKSELPALQLQEELMQAPAGRRRAVISGFVAERACRILGMDASKQLDPSTPLGDVGLDSLLAVELRNVLGNSLGKSLPATLLFEYPTVDALTDYLLTDVLGSNEPSVREQPTLHPSDLVGTIEALSDEEIDRMLATRAEVSV